MLSAAPAFADMVGCDESPISAASLRGLERAAIRAGVDQLALATLHHCIYDDNAQATVDSAPVSAGDRSVRMSSLTCISRRNRPRSWNCSGFRYDAMRLSPGRDQPEVFVQVYDRVLESTRARATEAFALLSEALRVEACSNNLGSTLPIDAVRAAFARRSGPYRISDSPDGFDLERGDFHIRFGQTATGGRMRIECWEEEYVEE